MDRDVALDCLYSTAIDLDDAGNPYGNGAEYLDKLGAGMPQAGALIACCVAGGPATGGPETVGACTYNHRVRRHACVACPAGSTNAAGDDPSGADTTCDATLCAANERVVGHACLACPKGTTSAAGADASSTDTACNVDCQDDPLWHERDDVGHTCASVEAANKKKKWK